LSVNTFTSFYLPLTEFSIIYETMHWCIMRLSPFFVVVQIVALFKHIQVLIIKKCMNKLVSFIFKAEVLFFILIFYMFKYLYNKILGHENFVKIIKNAGGGWQFFFML